MYLFQANIKWTSLNYFHLWFGVIRKCALNITINPTSALRYWEKFDTVFVNCRRIPCHIGTLTHPILGACQGRALQRAPSSMDDLLGQLKRFTEKTLNYRPSFDVYSKSLKWWRELPTRFLSINTRGQETRVVAYHRVMRTKWDQGSSGCSVVPDNDTV